MAIERQTLGGGDIIDDGFGGQTLDTYGTTSNPLTIGNNLSDLSNPPDARDNLGLGTVAVLNTGTSGPVVPVLNGLDTIWTGGATFGRTLTVRAFATEISTKTASFTIGSFDSVILADATTAPFTITLPTASSKTGRTLTFKKIDASVNTVTIDGNGTETIDGATTKIIIAQWSSVTIVSNGTSWFII